jgi:hypothetical protein
MANQQPATDIMLFLLNLCVLMGILQNCSFIAMAQLDVPDLDANSSFEVHDDIQNITRYAAHKNSPILELEDILSRRQQNPFAFLDPIDLRNPDNLATLNGPMLRSNWDCDHSVEKERTKLAFEMALELASEALRYMLAHGRNGPSYQRYFDGASYDAVEGIFMAMFNIDTVTRLHFNRQGNLLFENMDFRYDVPFAYKGWSSLYCVNPNNVALLKEGPDMGDVNTPHSRGLVFFCPRLSPTQSFHAMNTIPRYAQSFSLLRTLNTGSCRA